MSGTCRLCHRSHHTSLHRSQPTTAPASIPPPSSSPDRPTGRQPVISPAPRGLQQPQPDQHAVARGSHSDAPTTQPPPSWRYNASSAQQQQQHCFIQTALVEGRGPQGTRMLRVLLDGGSNASYIRKSVAEEMGLTVIGSGTFACIGFQEKAEEQRNYNRVKSDLQSRHGGEAREFELWSSGRLCAPILSVELPVGAAEGFILADDFSGGQIDILIGADQLYRAVLQDHVVLGERFRALDTIFGYVLHGQDSSTNQQTHQTYHCQKAEQMCDRNAIGITPDTETDKKRLHDPTWDAKEDRYAV